MYEIIFLLLVLLVVLFFSFGFIWKIDNLNKKIEEQNEKLEDQNHTIISQMEAIKEQNKTIAEQNKNIAKKENKILKQGTSIGKLHDTLTKTNENFNKAIESLNNKIKKNEDDIKKLKEENSAIRISFSLQKNLNNQISIYSRKKIMILENHYQRIINSYKLLYFRKMSNLILEYLFEKYNQYFAKTDNFFLDETKPEEKQRKLAIIGVSNRYNEISSINKNLINLIIDYLMYMKDITSSIIHISKSDYKIQIEILSEYIGKEIENTDGNYYISSLDLINLLFDDKEKEQENCGNKNITITNNNEDEEEILPKKLGNNKVKNQNFSEDISTIGISDNSEENKNGKLSLQNKSNMENNKLKIGDSLNNNNIKKITSYQKI